MILVMQYTDVHYLLPHCAELRMASTNQSLEHARGNPFLLLQSHGFTFSYPELHKRIVYQYSLLLVSSLPSLQPLVVMVPLAVLVVWGHLLAGENTGLRAVQQPTCSYVQ